MIVFEAIVCIKGYRAHPPPVSTFGGERTDAMQERDLCSRWERRPGMHGPLLIAVCISARRSARHSKVVVDTVGLLRSFHAAPCSRSDFCTATDEKV